MPIAALPNVLAMVTSLAAMVTLGLTVPRLGGQLGTVLRLVIGGVFFSVFLHAGFELAEVLGYVTSTSLMVIMGTLVTVGSICFCAAGVVGLRVLR